MQRLHIDHLNAHLGGGAAIAARRVHQGLVDAGLDSVFWYARGGAPPTDSYRKWEKPRRGVLRSWAGAAYAKLEHTWRRRRLKRALRGRPSNLEQFSPAQRPRRRSWNADAFRGHVLNLHWLGAEVDYPSFFSSLDPKKPIVWTLHDINPFSGGCHYANGCERFQTGCGDCPQLGLRSEDDLSRQTFDVKQDSIPVNQIHVVAPSRWLLELARTSPILGRAASFHLIPYGIDLQLFQPDSQIKARKRLGLPESQKIVAFGADDVENHRKGFASLRQALNYLAPNNPDLLCVCFGQAKDVFDQQNSPRIASLGFVRDKTRLADIYRAADVFVMPSLEDNLPQTGIESLACGTPVVAFAAGGIPDYVVAGQTGELAPVGQADRLAAAIASVLKNDARRQQMRRNARQLAESQFAAPRQAQAYESLYRDLLGRAQQRAA